MGAGKLQCNGPPESRSQQKRRKDAWCYDSSADRAACRKRHILRVIPHRSNARNGPGFFPKLLYKTRARIEQAMSKLRRVATRCEKTANSFSAIVAFACTMILVKSVRRPAAPTRRGAVGGPTPTTAHAVP